MQLPLSRLAKPADEIDGLVLLHGIFHFLDVFERLEVCLNRHRSRVTMEDERHLQLLASAQQLYGALQCPDPQELKESYKFDRDLPPTHTHTHNTILNQ